MNEIIKINYETEEPTVSARELHEKLNIEKRFSVWFETNSAGFAEGEDFTPYLWVHPQNKQEFTDYKCSVDMGKHICLMSRTEKGKQCRQQLIELEKAWNTPEQVMARAIKMADIKINELKNKNFLLEQEVEQKQEKIETLKPLADYTSIILSNKGLVNISQIAKDYGTTGSKMNNKLHEMHIQYNQGHQWLLYSEYQDKGYTHSVTEIYQEGLTKMRTKWTQLGRMFIYEKLKEENILPLIEQDYEDEL